MMPADHRCHLTFGPFRAALVEYLGAATPATTLDAAAHAGWALVHGLSMLRLDGSAAARGKPDDLQREHAALELFATSLASVGAMRRGDKGD